MPARCCAREPRRGLSRLARGSSHRGAAFSSSHRSAEGRPAPSPSLPPGRRCERERLRERQLVGPSRDQPLVSSPAVEQDQMRHVDPSEFRPRLTSPGTRNTGSAERNPSESRPGPSGTNAGQGELLGPVLQPGQLEDQQQEPSGEQEGMAGGADSGGPEARAPALPPRKKNADQGTSGKCASGCPRNPRQSHPAPRPTGQLTEATKGIQRARRRARRPARASGEAARGAPRHHDRPADAGKGVEGEQVWPERALLGHRLGGGEPGPVQPVPERQTRPARRRRRPTVSASVERRRRPAPSQHHQEQGAVRPRKDQ
jgi:hypothetical protein